MCLCICSYSFTVIVQLFTTNRGKAKKNETHSREIGFSRSFFMYFPLLLSFHPFDVVFSRVKTYSTRERCVYGENNEKNWANILQNQHGDSKKIPREKGKAKKKEKQIRKILKKIMRTFSVR